MDWKELFNSGYEKGETWADAELLIKTLSTKELKEFIEAHEIVEKLTGLDMRQKFYLTTAKIILSYKED